MKLHLGQMEARKERYNIDIIALLVFKIEHQWAKKKFAKALFIDLKKIFNHVSKVKLIAQMVEIGVDGNFI